MYKKYEKLLQQEFGLNFNSCINVIHKNGNETGIYPDVGLLLSRLSADSRTSFVLEFGSGMSTLVLSNACGKYNKRLITAEHHPKWYGISLKNLQDLGLDSNLEFVLTESDESRFPVIKDPVSFAWVDGIISEITDIAYGRLGACEYYWDYLKDAVLLFDDAQWNMELWTAWLREHGRNEYSEFIFNPTGREDRHILVSMPESNHFYKEVIHSCGL